MTLSPGFCFGGHLERTLPMPPAPDLSQSSDADRHWMMLALATAMASNGRSNPNPSVGCVIVKDGRCLAVGSTEICGGRHAERVALDSLPDPELARGATLYASLEPCAHYGRQPPCAQRVIAAGVARCVVAIGDPNPLVAGRGLQELRAHGIEVAQGVLGAEAAAWHLPFLAWQTRRRPLVAAKWAQTLDGQLAHDTGVPRWITGKSARAYAHWLRQRYDAIMVGAGTALADLPSLTVRDCAKPHNRHPTRLLYDPSGRVLRCPEDTWNLLMATLLSREAPSIAIIGEAAATPEVDARLECLSRLDNVSVLRIPAHVPPLEWTLERLTDPSLTPPGRHPIQSIMIEGGPRLLGLFGSLDLIDVAHVFISPSIGGGTCNRIPVGPALLPIACATLGDDVLAEYARPELLDLMRQATGPRGARAP